MSKGPSELLSSIQIDIGYEHYWRLKAIDQHDFSDVTRKVAQETGNSDQEYLNKGVHYLKRYYAMLVLDTLNPATMSLPVDPFWHFHTLYTHQYTAFCQHIFGEYLHHIPLLKDDAFAVRAVGKLYTAMLNKQSLMFIDFDPRFIPKDVMGGMCCTPSIVANQILRSEALFPADKPLRLSLR
jgi:hypothetical protein